ncbi:Innexin [Aphelenchoides bicaudatus]|nr:Innexin [Aphelenchoides bicaudatus]
MSAFVNRLLNNIKPRHDDDFVDRANYVYTALAFGVCASTIALKQYVGQPLQCWVPPHFTPAWEKYVENYCFAENTYFVSMNQDFPKTQEERESTELHYYQWVSLLLAAQMIASFLPKLLYNAANFDSSFNIERLVDTASMFEKGKEGYKIREQKKEDEATAERMDRHLRTRYTDFTQNRVEGLVGLRSYFHRSSLTKIYLLYKATNLAMTLTQIYLLNAYFWPDYDFWGIGFVRDLYNDHRWKESGEFPRVTFCDVEVREIAAKPIKYTLQCVIMQVLKHLTFNVLRFRINMFIEKIYVAVWFWLLCLSALNAFNLIHWFWCTHINSNNLEFIDHYLDLNGLKPDEYHSDLPDFVNHYLTIDGVTALRLLELNCGEVEASETVKSLWNYFKTAKKAYEKDNLLENNDDDVDGMNDANQMTQSTCTASTTVQSDLSPDPNYCDYPTLPIARQRMAAANNFPLSNV